MTCAPVAKAAKAGRVGDQRPRCRQLCQTLKTPISEVQRRETDSTADAGFPMRVCGTRVGIYGGGKLALSRLGILGGELNKRTVFARDRLTHRATNHQ